MKYPTGSCEDCGERLYATVDGGTFCPNCGDFDVSTEEAARTEGEGRDAVPEAP